MSRESSHTESRRIENMDVLLEVFEGGSRPLEAAKIGLETEMIGARRDTLGPVPFDGENGIEKLLYDLLERPEWDGVYDQGRLISLSKGQAAITLEPGGQLELSGEPFFWISEIEKELRSHLKDLCQMARKRKIWFVGVGIHPTATVASAEWVPKSRYAIMRPYYEKRHGNALDMMTLTASSQINMDYESEEDARVKVYVGSVLGPIVGAMMANSAVENRELNGFVSRRLDIWRHTDPDRCGVPSFFVDGSFSFEKYRDYALDVPMYFIIREGKYQNRTSMTFRQFVENEQKSDQPSLHDWISHLTTLFPDVRLKNHLEFRTADAQGPSLTLALVAFWKGIIYEKRTLDEVATYLRGVSKEEIDLGTRQASLHGLAGEMKNRKLLQWARDVVSLAVIGLSRLDQVSGRNEIRYLNPLLDLLERGFSKGEEIRRTYRGNVYNILRTSCVESELM